MRPEGRLDDPGRPMVPADVYRLQTIVDVALSPDGRLGAYVVHTCDAESDAEYASIWLLDVASGSSTPVAHSGHRNVFPKWSPDGTRLAFLSGRPIAAGEDDAVDNVFAIDVERPGEPAPLTRSRQPVSDFAWSPDGRRLCLVVRDDESQRVNADGTALTYDNMRFSQPPFTGWVDGTHEHLWVVDLQTEEAIQLTSGDADDYSPAWSPDGRTIVFVSNRRSDREIREAADIWTVAADASSEPRALTEAVVSSELDGAPVFSPDGTEVAYVGVADSAPGAHRPHPHLLVKRLDGGPERDLLADWDRPVGNHILTETRRHAGAPPALWSASGADLFFIGTDGPSAQLYRVPREGGQPTCLIPGEHELIAVSFDAARHRFLAVIGAGARPGELFLGEEGQPLRQLTNLNAPLLRELALTGLERFTFERDGAQLEGWVVKPPGFDPAKRYPLVLRIAGGPGLAYGHSFVEDTHILAGRGHVVAFINPRGTQSYGVNFTDALDGGWLGEDYHDQMAAVDHLLEAGYIDERRLGVVGASYGGLMVNWMVTQTDRFAAAVSQRSISNLVSMFGVGPLIWNLFTPDFKNANPYVDMDVYLSKSPLAHVANVETPLLLIQAGSDCMTPVGQAQEFFVALRVLGKPARLVVYPDGHHYLRRYGKPSSRVHYIETFTNWFEDHLAPAPAS